jgi:dCMP deaminase
MEQQRPSWDEYFFEILAAVSKRATCDRGKSAAVIMRDNQILTTGYVGAPPGLPHCDDVGHDLIWVKRGPGQEPTRHCVRTIHAEQNAMLQAARNGIKLDGATIYVTMEPCRTCAMFIISAGIKRVVAGKRYHAAGESRTMFAATGVVLEVLEDTLMTYAS